MMDLPSSLHLMYYGTVWISLGTLYITFNTLFTDNEKYLHARHDFK